MKATQEQLAHLMFCTGHIDLVADRIRAGATVKQIVSEMAHWGYDEATLTGAIYQALAKRDAE